MIRKATQATSEGKTETATEYKEKVINLVSQLNETQLEKLDRVLEEEANLEDELLDKVPEMLPAAIQPEPNQDDMADVKSVACSTLSKRSSSTAHTVIQKLEKQLMEERSEREKMKEEIEELKKMNLELASAIRGNSSK